MLTSLVGWLFVRNGPHQIDQRVHAFLLASTIIAVMLIQYISPIKYATTKLGQIAVGLLCLYGFHITLHPQNASLANNEAKSLTIATARRQSTTAPFYTPKENEPYWKIELQALMPGLRVEVNNHILPFGHVQLPTFTLHLTRLQMCSLEAYQSDHNMCPNS